MAEWLAYERRSRIDAKSRRQVESTDVQRRRIDDWAKARGVSVEHHTEPDGFRSGGSTEHRPEYQRLLKRIRSARKGEIAGVVVTDLDRAGRNERDLHDLFDEIADRGLELAVLDDGQVELVSTDGRFLAGLKALLAAQERRKIGDRIRTNAHDRQSRGIFVGQIMYGYKWAEIRDAAGRTQKMMVPHPEEAARLQAMYEYYLSLPSHLASGTVANWMNAQGWRTRRGNLWSEASVLRYLRQVRGYSDRVLFLRQNGGTTQHPITIPGLHEPIISTKLADQVEARFKVRQWRRGGQSGPRIYPLRYKLICGECGSPVASGPAARPSAPERTYFCRKMWACKQPIQDAAVIEAQVWEVLDDLYSRLPGIVVDAAMAMLEEMAPMLPPPRTKDDEGALRVQMQRLNELYIKGRIEQDDYERRYAVLEDRLAVATATVDDIGSPDDPLGLNAARRLLEEFELAREAGGLEGLRAAASALLADRGTIVRDHKVFSCTLVPPLERVRQMLMVQAS